MKTHNSFVFLLSFIVLYTCTLPIYGQDKSKKDDITSKTLKEIFIKKADENKFPKLRLRDDISEYVENYKKLDEYELI